MDSGQTDMQTGAQKGMPGGKEKNTIADYVGDMVSLETHIEEALDRQLGYVKDHPQALQAVQRFHTLVNANRDALKAHQSTVGSTAGNPIKEIGSNLLGKAAGMIDMIRTEGVSKALRDDYTAFNLAAMGYEMLHTTSHAMGDTKTMQLAEKGLRNHASMIQELNHLMPDIVIWELQKDGHTVDASVADSCRKEFDRIWKETAKTN